MPSHQRAMSNSGSWPETLGLRMMNWAMAKVEAAMVRSEPPAGILRRSQHHSQGIREVCRRALPVAAGEHPSRLTFVRWPRKESPPPTPHATCHMPHAMGIRQNSAPGTQKGLRPKTEALSDWNIWCGRGDSNPHGLWPLPPQDSVSTSSTTSASQRITAPGRCPEPRRSSGPVPRPEPRTTP